MRHEPPAASSTRATAPLTTPIYFSDFFGVPPDTLDAYGAFDISLINDLPLFVDPFLLFNSEKPEYQALHASIIGYMRFLKAAATEGELHPNLIDAWFRFPEVKENWLGFSAKGNKGHGLGADFAQALHRNFRTVFRDFGEETVSRSSHIEKLCLIRDGVGRDNISDFTANLIKSFLADYTQTFARQCVPPTLRRAFALPKAEFNYTTRTWATRTYELPSFAGAFVLLTPKDILTKDEAWINRPELLDRFPEIAAALPDAVLRAQVNDYLQRAIPTGPKVTQEEIHAALATALDRFPQVIDYYVRDKEEHGDQAQSVARARVEEVRARFVANVRALVDEFLTPLGFYATRGTTYDEARDRLMFLKSVIEDKGGHRLFYVDGQPVEREADLQLLYRLTWFATPSDISREVNDGRGPVDFKASRGAADKTLVELKLAKNTHLEQNLQKQAEVYSAASDAIHPPLKGILYFNEAEKDRVYKILKRLNLTNCPHIIVIDARDDNKPSGSKA